MLYYMGLSNDSRIQNSRSESNLRSPTDNFKGTDEQNETISTHLMCGFEV